MAHQVVRAVAAEAARQVARHHLTAAHRHLTAAHHRPMAAAVHQVVTECLTGNAKVLDVPTGTLHVQVTAALAEATLPSMAVLVDPVLVDPVPVAVARVVRTDTTDTATGTPPRQQVSATHRCLQ